MNPVVSVIIPVYKTERYIRKCIDSVLEQTYSDLQIILVDDGSPDSCPDICDEYVKKDPRCCVIHKSNGGVSSARNAGLDAATGDYICFVDSDDMLMTDSIETLCSILVEQGSQYVAGVCLTNDGRSALKTNKQIRTIDIAKKPSEMLEYITQPGSYSPYAKIYDRGIFNKYQIRFDENLKCSEDALMIRQYLKYCSQISLTTQAVYIYNTENTNSLSKKGYLEFSTYFSKKMEALVDLTDCLPIDAEDKKIFLTQRAIHGLKISSQHYFFHFKDREKRYLLLEQAIKDMREWLFLSNLNKNDDLYKWWKTNIRYIREYDISTFYKKDQHDHYFRMVRLSIKKAIKAVTKKV